MMSVAPILDPAFVTAFRIGTLTPDQAEAVLPRDRAAAIFFPLRLSTALGSPAPAGGAHTPSGTVPPYAKPSARPRRKKRGAVPGHPGAARPRPEQIERHESHQLPTCPACGGELTRTGRTRTRLVEDVPDDLRPEGTEHTIHRDWCPCCKKQVEPQVPDALPGCTLGNRTVVLSAWLHYGLGGTTRQIVDVFDRFFVEEFRGVLVTDFWAAYDAVGRTKHKCWPHLLRDLNEVDTGADNGGDWPEFAKRPRRVFGDAVRLELAREVKPPRASTA